MPKTGAGASGSLAGSGEAVSLAGSGAAVSWAGFGEAGSWAHRSGVSSRQMSRNTSLARAIWFAELGRIQVSQSPSPPTPLPVGARGAEFRKWFISPIWEARCLSVNNRSLIRIIALSAEGICSRSSHALSDDTLCSSGSGRCVSRETRVADWRECQAQSNDIPDRADAVGCAPASWDSPSHAARDN